MRNDYPQWLVEQKYSENTQITQIHRIKKVEEYYGDLDRHFAEGTYADVIASLQYSTSDERQNKPNPSKIKFDGNIRNNLQSYKNAVVRYKKFIQDSGFQGQGVDQDMNGVVERAPAEEGVKQRFALERDMQVALRRNITSLCTSLRIIDDGAERTVASGFIDITCEDDTSLVVIELKAGQGDSRAIGQILGYMGDLQEEEERPVRGILVAHSFDKRARAAARVVPTLILKEYAITFAFNDVG